MPEDWTADVVGRMHVARITGQMLAKECGYSVSYISMVLNSKKGTEETKARILDALERLEARVAEERA